MCKDEIKVNKVNIDIVKTYLSTLFTVKYSTNNKIEIENISIKLATTITQHIQKATMTATTKATVAMTTTTTTKIRITVEVAEKNNR